MPSAVILISGRGSNMRSLVEAGCGFDWRAVVSNRPKAAGLEWAAAKGLPARAMDHKDYATREAFDEALARTVAEYAPDYVFLAGFMRILTEGFIARYPRRILNIHPSLLPVFPGLHTHRRALEAGVKLHGATVHFVTPDLDHGPILGQPEQPRLWIPALRAWRQSANLDKAETKTKHGIRNFGILVETGGQPNRGGKFKACQPDRECGICCRARHWREQPEGRNGQAMCTFGVERKQQGADKGKE